MTERDRDELQALEESLWEEDTRFDRHYMERILADDFYEIGKSGCTYDREETLSVSHSRIGATISLPQFRACLLSEHVALVTYQSVQAGGGAVRRAWRSSVWTRASGRWLLRFHQGTPAPLGQA